MAVPGALLVPWIDVQVIIFHTMYLGAKYRTSWSGAEEALASRAHSRNAKLSEAARKGKRKPGGLGRCHCRWGRRASTADPDPEGWRNEPGRGGRRLTQV